MRYKPLFKILLAVSLVLSLVSQYCDAEVKVTTQAVTEVRYLGEEGQFYQLQRLTGSGLWENIGQPSQATGQEVVTYEKNIPGAKYRVTQLHDQWVLVWSDEFEGDKLNPAKWSKEENGYGGGNNEKQFYSVDPKYCYVKDSRLHLAVYREPHTTMDGKTQPYTSARIRSLERGEWTYGRFEIRAKVPGGSGIWPAIWMMPTHSKYGGWAACGEIDIMESRGSNVHETLGTIHFGGGWPRNKHLGDSYTFPDKNAAEAFHVYSIEWEKDAIRWYVDGVCFQTRTSDEWSSESAPDSKTAPFDQPFHMILNVAVDGGFFGGTSQKSTDLPDSAFPQIMEVDYVRVYQWAK